MSEHWIEHDQARLYAVAAGRPSDPPVLLLHAGVADHRMWRSQLKALGRSGRYAIAFDRRGFGNTTTPDVPFCHVEDALAVLDALSPTPQARWIGCSQGGRIAIDAALAHPERVESLTLLAPAVSGWSSSTPNPPAVDALFESIEQADEAGDLERLNELEARAWLDGYSRPPGRVGGGVRKLFLDMNGRALRAPPLTQERDPPSAVSRLDELPTTTRVICGTLDFPHVQRRSADVARAVGTVVIQLEGVAHLPSMEQPAAIDRLLLGG
ncbi:MAG: alpha/beta hydrolase [Myxococcales bacterium]|nr:alpha/beta hydrolase [Myxococcales bacterium]